MTRILAYLKKEIVMTLSLILAILSAFLVHPDKEYIEYIDVRTLGLLFCLMLVVKGFQRIGAFDMLAGMLFAKVKGSRMLIQILVGLCFVSSMFITNDVALITFVPFAILALQKSNLQKHMILTVVLQTIAANLGSMFTPIGNPQNLYLFGISDLGILEFFGITGPLTLISLILLFVVTLFVKNQPIEVCLEMSTGDRLGDISENEKGSTGLNAKRSKPEKTGIPTTTQNTKEVAIYTLLFLIDLAVVFRLFHWVIAVVISIVGVLIIKRKELLKQVDYALLITFVGFFIFVGNLGRVPMISEAIQALITNREIVVSALFSQFMSNVPAAILLAGFTENIKALIIGTNVGGLGTVIASMASLISYKIYAETEGAQKGRYMLDFTIYNVIGLMLLLGISLIIY